jgi:hypothetical protein
MTMVAVAVWNVIVRDVATAFLTIVANAYPTPTI